MKQTSNSPTVIAVIQARMGSTRLPDKVLKKIEGKTIVAIAAERLRAAKLIDGIVLAIPDKQKDDVLAEEGERLGLLVYRGSEMDIPARMLGAAKLAGNAGAVIRVTADCPLVDPAIVDRVAGIFKKEPSMYDYVGNILDHTYPVGLGVELFTVDLIKKVMRKLKTPAERELISTYVKTNWPIERIAHFRHKNDLSSIRLTLDYPEDLRLISLIYSELSKTKPIFNLVDILDFIDKHPNILSINRKRINREQLLNLREKRS